MAICHCGQDPERAEADLRPLRTFGSPIADMVQRVPYPAANTGLDWLFNPGTLSYWKSAFFSELSDAAIAVLHDAFERAPTDLCALAIEDFHGAVTRVEPTATAYPHREPGHNLLLISQWTDPADTDRGIAWARTTFEELGPHMAERSYTNYLPADDHDRVRRGLRRQLRPSRRAQATLRPQQPVPPEPEPRPIMNRPRAAPTTSQDDRYLLANQPSELDRLQLQSLVWEPSGRQLLSKLGGGSGGRALDVGCGALGWLRLLSNWVGPSGQVVGTDIDESLLNAARSFLQEEEIANVELVLDDLFDSKLEPQSFDLVHARYVIAPLGRGREQVAAHRRLVKPGGSLVLEEWDLGSWHFNPPAPAAERLIRLISEIFAGLGGEAGRGLPELLREIGIEEPEVDAHVIALKPGHPYLRHAASVQRRARIAPA